MQQNEQLKLYFELLQEISNPIVINFSMSELQHLRTEIEEGNVQKKEIIQTTVTQIIARAEQKAKDVHNAINKLRKEGQFTLADLCREAGVSRSYFTKHPEMRALANKYIKSTGRTIVRSQDSKDTLFPNNY